MRKGLGQALRLGVSREAVSLLRSSRWRGAPLSVLAECACAPAPGAADDFSAIGVALDTVFGGDSYAGWPLSVVLDDALLRIWQVTPPPGASRPDDLDAAAALRFQTLYGDAAADWCLAGDWRPRAPFYAAVPRALLAQLERVAGAHGMAIVAVVPHFIAAWNRWQGALKPGAWFGQVHGQMLSIGAVEGGRLRAVRALALPHGAEHYWLGQALAREALLLDLAAPELLQLCGHAPPGWSKAPANPGQLSVEPLPAGPSAAFAAALAAAHPSATLAACGVRS